MRCVTMLLSQKIAAKKGLSVATSVPRAIRSSSIGASGASSGWRRTAPAAGASAAAPAPTVGTSGTSVARATGLATLSPRASERLDGDAGAQATRTTARARASRGLPPPYMVPSFRRRAAAVGPARPSQARPGSDQVAVLRVEVVAQPVAEQVDADDGDRDRQAGERRVPPGDGRS